MQICETEFIEIMKHIHNNNVNGDNNTNKYLYKRKYIIMFI